MELVIRGMNRDAGSKIILPKFKHWIDRYGCIKLGPSLSSDGRGGIIVEFPTDKFTANGNYFGTFTISKDDLEEMIQRR